MSWYRGEGPAGIRTLRGGHGEKEEKNCHLQNAREAKGRGCMEEVRWLQKEKKKPEIVVKIATLPQMMAGSFLRELLCAFWGPSKPPFAFE